MADKRRFRRPLGKRRYKRLFVIATEGTVTEVEYFSMFNNTNKKVHVKCLETKKGNSSPKHVLNRLKKFLKENNIRKSDEVWIVVDTDNWPISKLNELVNWAREKENRGVAVSNPCFEYWLLLHFENGTHIYNTKELYIRLKKHLPHYDKHIEPSRFLPLVPKAITRAEKVVGTDFKEYPTTTGTTVYVLAKQLLAVSKE